MLRLALVMHKIPTSTMLDGARPADKAQDFLNTLFPLLQGDDWGEADAYIDGFLETSALTKSLERWEWDAIEWVIRPRSFGRRYNDAIEEQARELGLTVKRQRQMGLTLDSLFF